MKSNKIKANIWIFPLQFSEQRRPSHCRKRLQLFSLLTVDFDLRTSILIWLGDNWLSKILLVDFYKYSTLKESHSHGFPKELMSGLRHSSGSWGVAALLRRSRTLRLRFSALLISAWLMSPVSSQKTKIHHAEAYDLLMFSILSLFGCESSHISRLAIMSVSQLVSQQLQNKAK